MTTLRAIIRAVLIILILLGMYGFFFLNCLTARSSRDQRRAGILKNGCVLLSRVVGLKIQAVGPVPKPPFILVSNHLSYLDILVLASRVDAVFISKAEVRQWPFLGFLCHLAGTIFINRKNRSEIPHVNRLIQERYEAGQGIVFFPEGTSTGGETVKAFKGALLESAVRNGYPVHYASLFYKTPRGCAPAHQSVCWWGDMEFVPHFKAVLGIPWIKTKIRFGKRPLKHEDREALARQLHQAVLDEFIPTMDRSNAKGKTA